MALSDVITSTLTLADSSPNRSDFGTPVILADAPFVGARLYTADPAGLSAMITDGFILGSRAHQIGNDIAAQRNGTDKFWVFARQVSHVQSFKLTPTNITEDYVYLFEVSAWNATTSVQATTTITYTVLAAATVASVVTALHALVDAVVGITATDDTTSVGLAPTTAETFVFANDLPSDLELIDDGSDAGIAADLAQAVIDIEQAGGDFYGILIDSFNEAEIQATGTFAEANKKLFMPYSVDADVADPGSSTDVASDLQTSNYDYTGVFLGRRLMSVHNGAASMSYLFGSAPGQAVVANHTLQGPGADNWTPTEKSTARGKNANLYVLSAGVSHGLDGWAASTRFFDITRNLDWFENLAQVNLFQILNANPVVPYTDAGLTLLEAGLRAAMNAAETQGVLAAGWTIDVIPVASVPTLDKTARVYNGFTLNGTIQGAIQSVNFSIVLKV